MRCREFVLEMEDCLARQPEVVEGQLPAWLELHAGQCERCRTAWSDALTARCLLYSLRGPGTAQPAERFLGDLSQRIERDGADWLAHLSARDIALATALFVAMLGAFVVDIHYVEVLRAGAPLTTLSETAGVSGDNLAGLLTGP